MNISVDKNREINISGENEKGTQNENLIQSLTLQVPEEYSGYNKKIVFIINGTEILWDLFDENDTYVLGTAITQYESVDYYIWLTHEDKDFRTKTRTLYFNQNKDASGQITPEEISGVNTVIALLEEEITKVDNINIVATKENQVTTITITDKDGESHSVEIPDGQDAKINGYNTITIQSGDNIEIIQDEDELTINNTYEYDDTEVKQDITRIEGNITDINTTLGNKADKSEIPTKVSQLQNDSGFINKNVNDLTNYTKTGDMNTAINNAVNTEKTLRENSDTNLQSQIDAITSASDVVDIVGTYQELQQYDTSKLTEDDVIKVLQDSTHSNALSYFRWKNNQWNYVGSEGPFYTKGETDALLNAKQNEIDSTHKLNADLVDDTNSNNKFVTASDKTNWNAKVDEEDIADFVKNTDYADYNEGGVVKKGNGFTTTSSGTASCGVDTYTDYQSKSGNQFISKGTLENVITGKQLINATQLQESQQPQDESIEEMQEILSNIPTTTGTGESITLDNTMKCKHTADELGGNTDQETTTGKNKIDITSGTINTSTPTTVTKNSDGTITINGSNNATYTNITDITGIGGITTGQDYKISFAVISGTWNAGTMGLRLYDSNNTQIVTIQGNLNSQETKTISSQVAKAELYTTGAFSSTNLKLGIMLLPSSETSTSWEKYTGGIASPNPSYPSPVNVVKGDNEVVVGNKNLCNGINQNYYLNAATTNAGNIVGNSGLVIEGKGKTYTISTTKVQERMRAACINELPVGSAVVTAYLGQHKDNTSNSITINTNGYKYLVINITDLSAVQIEEGSTVTAFQPHAEQVYPINLGDIELAKIGSYQDKLFKAISGDVVYDSLTSTQKEGLTSGSWYKLGEIDMSTLKNNNIVLQSINSYGIANFLVQPLEIDVMDTSTLNNSLCNRFSPQYSSIADTTTEGFLRTLNGQNHQLGVYIRLHSSKADTVEKFITWLNNNETKYYWALSTPTFTEITDTTLISQLENWRNSKSYNGQTNISQTNEDKAFVISYTTLKEFTDGTITSIKMNNTVKGTTGEVDLGTVITQHQDISGKLNTSKVKSSQSTTSGDVYDVTYINSMLGNIETLLGGI